MKYDFLLSEPPKSRLVQPRESQERSYGIELKVFLFNRLLFRCLRLSLSILSTKIFIFEFDVFSCEFLIEIPVGALRFSHDWSRTHLLAFILRSQKLRFFDGQKLESFDVEENPRDKDEVVQLLYFNF